MDEARRERIKTIFDKHAAPDLRSALLQEIPYREVAPNETLNTIELLEWVLQNKFLLDQVVFFTNERKTAVRFVVGVATGEKKNIPFMAEHAYQGHFLMHKGREKIISYGKRTDIIPDDIDWRVLLQLEIQLPMPRLVPWMPPPRGEMILLDLRQIFEKFETTNLLLKDRKILDIMKQQFPSDQWVMGAIYKIPETPQEAQRMEKAWESAQAFDPNPMNLPSMLRKIQMMTKAMVEQLPLEKSKSEELRDLVGKLENSQKEWDLTSLIFNLQMQILQDPIEAQARIWAHLERDPKQDELWLMLGSLLAGQFRWDEALDAFTRSKDLNPTDPFSTDCMEIALDALGERTYQGKWEIKEMTEESLREKNMAGVDPENFHRKECLQRTLKALALHSYWRDQKRGEELIAKMLAKCTDEEKVHFYNGIGWSLYSQHTADPSILKIGKNLSERAVALAKKIKSKLLVNCLDSQACLASSLGEYEESKTLFEEAIELNPSFQGSITWAEFARVLKALGDDMSYKKYKDFF